MPNQFNWQRVFIRSGFYCEQLSDGYDFSLENQWNIKYLKSILHVLGLGLYLQGKIFSPPKREYDQFKWLRAVEKLHIGAEYGQPNMNKIELNIMDTYMAGLVRWINKAGLETGYSCDGHGKNHPVLMLVNIEDMAIFDKLLKELSGGQWFLKRNTYSYCPDYLEIRNADSSSNKYDRLWLLEVAEVIFNRQSQLVNMIKDYKGY